MKYVKNALCVHARMLPSFESQKTVTEKTTKGEAQAYSPLETPFRRGDYQSPAFNILNHNLFFIFQS